MIKNGKIFGIVNVIDFAVVSFVLLAVLGLLLVKSGKFKTAGKVVQKQSQIQFDVAIRGVKLSKVDPLFKDNDKTFITIRNVPYTELKIVKSLMTPWQTVIPDPNNSLKALAVVDPTESYTYNFLVTITDKADITKDGPVIGGNKVKIGLPITLEGFDYRLNGTVSDVRVLK